MASDPHPSFVPCPTCKQYSHSLGEDQVADAYVHFQAMVIPDHKTWPTHNMFDERTRDAANVLMAEIERLRHERDCAFETLEEQQVRSAGRKL